MNSIFDIFKIGIGPSSSHTMGPMIVCNKIIDRITKHQLSTRVTDIKIELFGSLAYTGKAHGTDKALIAGLYGLKPDSIKLQKMKSLYDRVKKEKQIVLPGNIPVPFDVDSNIIYNIKDIPKHHSNALSIYVYTYNQEILFNKTYYSTGGGVVVSENKIQSKPLFLEYPYKYKNASELLSICEEEKLNIWDVVLINEKSQIDEDEINTNIDKIWATMNDSIELGIKTKGILDGGLKVERRAPDLFKILNNDQSQDKLLQLDYVNVYAIAVNEENSSGGRVVTAPTNGAAGVIPAVIRVWI